MKSKRKNTKLQQQKDKLLNLFLLKSALVVFSTMLVVYFLPRFNNFNYSYEVNQPWNYGTLISTQKFNIQMSDSVRLHKRDSILNSFYPYYNLKNGVCEDVKVKLHATADAIGADSASVEKIAGLIDSVYAKGVISMANMDSLHLHSTSFIRVVDNNHAVRTSIGDVFTTKTAYKYLIDNAPKTHTEDGQSLMSRLNLNTVLEDNLKYDDVKSSAALEDSYNSMSLSLGFVRVNEKIVDRGDIITPDVYQKLKSYEAVVNGQTDKLNNEASRQSWTMLLGQVALVFFLMVILVVYLSVYRKDYLENKRSAILLFSMITLFSILASTMISHHFFHVYVLPCCMMPIIVRVFLDSRTAFASYCVMVLLISFTLNSPFEFIVLQLVAGLVAILKLREMSQRSQIIHVAISVSITYVVFYCSLQFITGAEWNDIDWHIVRYFLINGALLIFVYPLFYMMEKTFGFVTDATLIELSNVSNPLLKQLSEDAQGTFQHSMQVANLAADVAQKIGARVQLVRTGALYHDIGKVDRPVFFTENQSGGNPHNHLSPVKSAEVIINHVKKGLELANKYNLPQPIKDLIATHHGTGQAKYFLITYKNEHPDEEIDESLFTYPGPDPKTKEEAILMMSDAIEAASRSLQEYTEESISLLVNRIIDDQVNSGFFQNCPITLRDITMAKEIFQERLKMMYHTRISYPELAKSAQ